MRAIFLEGESFTEGEFLIKGEKTHHLLNVVRLKPGQNLLLLNGSGIKAYATVEKITKKVVEANITKIEKVEVRGALSIAFALPKKDALEISLRSSVEIGAKEIIILSTQRSQTYPVKKDRIDKIITAAMEQSNNPFLPQFKFMSLDELDLGSYKQTVLATLKKRETVLSKSVDETLLIIGPEGGLSDVEEDELLAKGACPLRVDIPILRTQTAIPFLSGHLLGLAREC